MNINLLDRIYAVNPVTGEINRATVVEPPYIYEGNEYVDVMIGDDINTIYTSLPVSDIRSEHELAIQESGSMLRTGRNIIHDLKTGKTYQRKPGEAGVYIYCDNQRISESETTDAVWDYLLSLVHTELR